MSWAYRSAIPFGMLSLLLLVAGSAAAEPNRSVNEKAAVAPQQKDRSNVNSAVSAWHYQLVRSIRSKHRYPAGAALLGERVTVKVAFSVDGQGRVTTSRIDRSSGSAALDNAALEMVRQAQPFPPPPPGARLDFILPVVYDPQLACGSGDRWLFARDYCARRSRSQKPQ
jgi:TonB family protein